MRMQARASICEVIFVAKRKNGEGSFIHLPSGKVRMRKQHGVLSNGKQRIITVTGTSETDCIRKMKAKIENDAGVAMSDENVKRLTLTDLCTNHFKQHLSEKNRLKPKAADRRESTIRNQIAKYPIGHMQAVNITSLDIENHIEMLIRDSGLSVSSIKKTLDVINSAYKWAVAKGVIANNPCVPVLESIKTRLSNLEKRNSSDGVVNVLSDDQIRLINNQVNRLVNSAIHTRLLGLSVSLLIETGMRSGELCALRWKDWDADTHTLSIDKTRNVAKDRSVSVSSYKTNENEVKNYHARTIDLSDKAQSILTEMKRITVKDDDDDYILVNRSNNPTNPSNFGRNINVFYEQVGLPEEITGAHILRRTCATNMHYDGCLLEDIAAYLGDTPETIVRHYISLTKKVVSNGRVKNVVQLPQRKMR